MVTINDLPEHPGRLVFTRRRNLREQITIGGGAVDWKNVVIVDPDGGGDFTDIQSAIDSITTASNGDEFLVLIMGGTATGDYAVTGAITLKEFVHLRGIGPRVPRIQITISGATPGLDTVGSGNTVIQDLRFIFAGSGTVAVSTNSGDGNIEFINCSFSGSGKVDAASGEFRDCTFTGIDIEVNGSGTNHEDSPRFWDCRIEGDYDLTSAAVTSTGQFVGGFITTSRTFASTSKIFNNIDSPDVVFSGVTFLSTDGSGIETSAAYSGCTFFLDKSGSGSSVSIFRLTGQARFDGCTFHFTGPGGNSNSGHIEIQSSATSPNTLNGCSITTGNNNKVFFFNAGYSVDAWPLIVNGCMIRAGTTGGGALFGVHSSGCPGSPVIELSGNNIHAGFAKVQLSNNHATGQDIRLRGRDVKTVWFPVEANAGTAKDLVNFTPVGKLTAQNDVAYINAGYIGVPVDIDDPLSTHLVVASDVGLEEDTFTDTAGTNLNAHTSDSGNSWTARAGTITISAGNQATVNASELYTYTITSADGFIRASFTNATGSGTRSAFLVFRWADASSYWFVEYSRETSSVKLFKRVAGANTEMGEADLNYATTMTIGVSFINDEIIVYTGAVASPTNLIPVIRVSDSALNANTNIGLGGRGNAVVHIDDFKFYPSRDADITVDAEMTHEGEPFDNQSQTQGFSGGTAIPSVRETPTFIDISSALNNLEQAQFVSLRVTLDSAGLGGNLYIMGVMIQYLHFARDFRGDTALRQYRPFR